MTPTAWHRIEKLYHFTLESNIKGIREHGILPTSDLRAQGIPFVPGGDEASLNLDQNRGFDGYVRLSLTSSHPMISHVRARHEGQEVVVLRVLPDVLDFSGVMFSPGIAYGTGVSVVPFNEAVQKGLIDFAAFGWLDWKTPGGQARRQNLDKCEVLVPKAVTPGLIEIP